MTTAVQVTDVLYFQFNLPSIHNSATASNCYQVEVCDNLYIAIGYMLTTGTIVWPSRFLCFVANAQIELFAKVSVFLVYLINSKLTWKSHIGFHWGKLLHRF